jgi:hypothetical protein
VVTVLVGGIGVSVVIAKVQGRRGDGGHAVDQHSGRKIRYARLLVDALDLTSVPRPLDRLLAHI